jgi:hypothetical protein
MDSAANSPLPPKYIKNLDKPKICSSYVSVCAASFSWSTPCITCTAMIPRITYLLSNKVCNNTVAEIV